MKQIKDVRNIIKDLAKAMKSYSDVNKHGALVFLMDELKKRKRVLRSAKDSRKRRWHRKPAKEVITPKVKSESKVPKSVLNEFIQKVASDLDRTVLFGDLDGVDDISINIGKFNSKNSKISELFQVVKKKRHVSQLGPNQIPYKVYKKCPRIMNYIFRIIFIAARDKVTPLNWSISDRIMISRVQNPRQSNLADYRQIVLRSVEEKLLWSLIAQRFNQHLVTTGYRIEKTPLVETPQSLLIFLTLLLNYNQLQKI